MQNSAAILKRRLVRTGRILLGDGRGWTLLVVAAGWLSILGSRYLFPVLLPQFRQMFGVSNATAGAVITIIWVGYGVMQFPAGMLVDRFGERTLLTSSLVVAAAAITAVSLAPTFWLFAVGCALLGLGTGLYGPSRGTVISKTFGEHDGAAIGLVLAVGSIGSAAFPYLGSLLVGQLGWQRIVALLIVPFLLVGAGVWWVVPQSPITTSSASRQSSREWFGALRSAVSQRGVAIAMGAVTLLLFVLQGLTTFLPTYLITVKGLSQGTTAGLFALFFLSGAVAQLVAGNAADRYGDRVVLLATAGFGILPLLSLPFVQGLLPLSILTMLLGSRLAINPVSNAYTIAVLPESVQGTAWGFLRTGFFLLAATSSTVIGAFFDAGLANMAVFVLAALTAIATGLYVFLPTRCAVDASPRR